MEKKFPKFPSQYLYHGKEVGGPYNPKPDFHMHNKRARVYLYKFGKMQKFKKFKIDV